MLTKVERERPYLNTIKTIYDKPTTNIILNSKKLKVFLLNSQIIQRCLTATIQHSIGSPSHSNQAHIHTHICNPNWKRRSKTSVLHLSTDDMILYIETQRLHQKFIRTNKWMHKVAAYKINIQKSTVFLYTSNVYYQEEKKENNPIYNCVKE